MGEDQLANDQEAQAIKRHMDAAVDHIKKDLRYSTMPDLAYKRWLDGVNEFANKKQRIVKRRQLD